MGDAFGPPLTVIPFQRYEVYRKETTHFVFGFDKCRRDYSLLLVHSDQHGNLDLQQGEERRSQTRFQAHLSELSLEPHEQVAAASGLIGFIRFLQGHYMILIKKHKKVGKVGHHYVLSIEETLLLPLFTESPKLFHQEKEFRDQFSKMNLSKDFYFSFSYDISRSLQQNYADGLRASPGSLRPLFKEQDPKHHRFVWNHYHLSPFLQRPGWQHWCLCVIHGFFAYTKCSSFGFSFEVVLVARRSRFYAGTRYRKRGLNVDGQVGNEIETEQILCDDSTRHFRKGHALSFVQIRGSVPLFWSQEATVINPKPPIVYPRCDPTLSATRRHFADLLERYGTPQLAVNLMKAKKADSCEVRLSRHFESAIERLNRELPASKRILYRPFDMKNHAKSNSIFEVFPRLAETVVKRVGFFHTSSGLPQTPHQVQSGVARTNCVDCLDRTSVLQLFIGLEVLKQQLAALNLLPGPVLDFNSQVVIVLSELYDLMGDHLALQYAGSITHKKYQLWGSRPRMMKLSKELITSIHRHYNTAWRADDKQACLNLFLGIYRPWTHPRLSDLDCDSWLHHRVLHDDYTPGAWWEEPLKSYDLNMGVLRGNSADCGMSSTATSPDAAAWFHTVHKVWKITWFEKLLSRLEATFVQINQSAKKIEASEKEQKGAEKELVQSLGPDPRENRADEADLQVYKTYAERRSICRLIWEASKGPEAPVLSDVEVPFSYAEAEKQEPKDEDMRLQPQDSTGALGLGSALRLLRTALQEQRPAATRPRVRLCSYCSAAFEDAAETKALAPDGGALCARHSQRAVKLQRFCTFRSFQVKAETQRSPPVPSRGCAGTAPSAPSSPSSLLSRREAPGTQSLARENTREPRFPSDALGGLPQSRPSLWSYAFPHAAPPLTDVGHLGLPEWWLAAELEANAKAVSARSASPRRRTRIRTPSPPGRPTAACFLDAGDVVPKHGRRSIFAGGNFEEVLRDLNTLSESQSHGLLAS